MLRHIQLCSGFCACVCEWIIFWQGWPLPLEGKSPRDTHLHSFWANVADPFTSSLSTCIALSRLYLWQETEKKKTKTPKPRNYLFSNLAFISEQLRWGRIEPWFQQQPQQFGVCSLRVCYSKMGEVFILFHSSWKKMFLSHNVICTLILENFNHMPFSSRGGSWNYNPSVIIRLIEFDC